MRIVPLLVLAALHAGVGRCVAQEPWLAEVPTARKVADAYQAGASRLGAARAAEAMYALTNVIGSLAGTAGLSPEAKGRMAELSAGQEAVLNAQYEKDRETYKVAQCEQAYAESPEFHRELLDHFFSPQWISTYGARLDVRRWRVPLLLPPGTRPPGVLLPACGPAPAQVATTAQPSRREEAVQLVTKGQYQEAVAIFEPLAAAYPDDVVTLTFLGTSYRRLGRPADAVPLLRRATRIKTTLEMTVLAHQQYALASLATGDRTAAVESWRALKVLDTAIAHGVEVSIRKADSAAAAGTTAASPVATASAAATAEAEGQKRLAAKDYKGARKSFRAAIAADPRRASAFAYLGDTWDQEMRDLAGGDSAAYSRAFDLAWDSSTAAWQHAVELKPQDAKLLVAIGDRQRDLDPTQGFEAYAQALDLKPDAETASTAWAGLGWVARFLTMDKDAMTYFNNAARLDWKNADAAYGLGLSLAKARARGPAMAQYRKLLQLKEDAKAQSVLEEINERTGGP